MAHQLSSRTVKGALAAMTGLTALAGLGGSGEQAEAAGNREPIVIAHRGASEYRPEHTLAAYRMAIAMGADYIEPDVVSTKDHVLVVRHENEISGTTDVESRPEFADRRRNKSIDGQQITGWFTEDFTLAELRTLRAEERVPDLRPDNTAFNGLYQIPTLREVLQLARRERVGVYPETKHPTYFDSIGLSLEEPLVALLHSHGFRTKQGSAYIQSFETANLRELARMTRLPLIQLIHETGAPYDFVKSGDPRTYDDLVTPEGLAWIARYAAGVGVHWSRIVPADPDGNLGKPTRLIPDARARRLLVHAWTIRNQNSQLPADFRQGNSASPSYPRAVGNVPGWLALLYRLGVDGLFADDPGLAIATRTKVHGTR